MLSTESQESHQEQKQEHPHRKAPKLNLDTSLASRHKNGAPQAPRATTSYQIKPLILTATDEAHTEKSKSHSPSSKSTPDRPHLALDLGAHTSRLLASTSPTVNVTPTRNVNASFLDDPTPIDADMADQRVPGALRDSHDLSLSSHDITRDSLVNNMLLSLDQFSMGQTGASDPYGSTSRNHDDSRVWANDSLTGARLAGLDGPKHQYTYSSSEYDDDSSRPSTQIPRSRRSDSGSTFQGPFPKLNNLPDSGHRTQPGTPRGVHNRARGSTKSSGSSASIDAGYPQNIPGGQRWARAGFRRSASFDLGHPQTQLLGSPFRVDLPSTLASDSFSAAPTPTVPGGPCRVASNIHIPPPPPQPADPPALERRRSTSRSIKSTTSRAKRAVNPAPAVAMAVDDFDSAPAPSVSYGKSKTEQPSSQSTNAPVPPKERQGFFRRVFGSSKSSSTVSTAPVVDTPSPSRFANQPSTAPPSRDTSSSHSHPVLQKKPSSFFRRRKKSVVDERPPLPGDIPPVPPLADANINAEVDGPSVSVSPASSLRKVMNPYLRDGPGQTSPLSDITNSASGGAEGYDERAEYKREFSPDYEPSLNAKIRTVPSDSTQEDSRWSGEGSATKLSPRLAQGAQNKNGSFLDLEGGSENDESPTGRRAYYPNNNKENELAVTSPTTYKNRDSSGTIRAKRSPYVEEGGETEDSGRPKLTISTSGPPRTSFASGSTETDYKTAPSATPSVHIEGPGEPSPPLPGTFDMIKTRGFDEPEFVIGEPTEDDRQKSRQIFDGAEDFIPKEKAASWMGEEGPVRQRTLQAYFELYNFTDMSIVSALRKVCGRLVLRGETQQVDRILVAFSKRWCQCNPYHGFKATDVIHTICYSIMLLNTDLHLADIEQKMTKSQFVKNTLTTISQAVAESAPSAFDRPSILPEKSPKLAENFYSSMEQEKKGFRNSFRPPPRTDTQGSDTSEDCGPLVKHPFNGSMKAWEELVEAVLKTIYASIRDESLPLFGAEPERHLNAAPSQSNLSVIGVLKRSPSVLSKAPSESQVSARGRVADSRSAAARWASKSRSRPAVGRTGFSSSRTSFDDGSSLWSPAMSSATWSRYSLGRTQGSMSQDSFASAMPRGDYQQSIGFANALSQAIIRDDDANGLDSSSIMSAEVPATQLMEDESLELAGPPWVKEGRVMHKHHLEGVGKRTKDRNWTEVFAVIQRGQMSIFSFNASKSMRQKSRSRNAGKTNAPVGGGNWQDNAVNLGTFNLRLTLASALPSPGYSRTRPYVWALSLPTGAVHLFQVGTPEIIKEFVNTANYWSARLSTHPLLGGISNVEYGWSDAVVNNSLVNAINDSASIRSGGMPSRPGSAAAHTRKTSAQSGSFHIASFDHGSGTFTNNSGRGKLPGDRIHISGWTPPTQSMRPCNLLEAQQLESLTAYVKNIEDDLQTHNQLRSPMLLAFTPRGQNANKAMTNWERKSSYLLRESVKFRTYVDALHQAELRKLEIYNERELARRAARGELSDGEMDASNEEGDETLRP